MSAEQGTLVGSRTPRVSFSLIVTMLIGLIAFAGAALLLREGKTELAPALNANLADSEAAVREPHDALGRPGAFDALNPANLADTEAAVRERHDELGRLGAFDALNPANLADTEAAARERHDALGRLGAFGALNPAGLADSGAAARERHEALGELGANKR